MNQKIDITIQIAKLLGLDTDDKTIKKLASIWWQSIRKKDKGGLRLSEKGQEAFQKAQIKSYKIKFQDQIHFTNQLVIWLDHFIECPFFITHKEIIVYSEKMAVQLVLFSGNVYQYSSAKAKSLSS